MSLRKLVAALLVGGVCLLPSAARADTNVWDKVRDPERSRADIVLRMVERAARDMGQARRADRELAKRFQMRMLALLQAARHLKDPRLDYLEGGLLVESRHPKAIAEGRTLLLRALKAAPDSPQAPMAWFNLGIASAKLGDAKQEHEAYTRALEVVWDPEFRANIYLNRGESKMVQGQLWEARRDYQHAVRLASRPQIQSLGYWGLGIVQERLGDLPSALKSVQLATSIDPRALTATSVFFVPRYDLHYYKGLGYMGQARAARTPVGKLVGYRHAAQEWALYLESAEPDKHRWVPNARLHLKACQRHAAELTKQVEAERKRQLESRKAVPRLNKRLRKRPPRRRQPANKPPVRP